MGLRVKATIIGNYGTCGLSVSELRCEVKCNNHSCLLTLSKNQIFCISRAKVGATLRFIS